MHIKIYFSQSNLPVGQIQCHLILNCDVGKCNNTMCSLKSCNIMKSKINCIIFMFFYDTSHCRARCSGVPRHRTVFNFKRVFPCGSSITNNVDQTLISITSWNIESFYFHLYLENHPIVRSYTSLYHSLTYSLSHLLSSNPR